MAVLALLDSQKLISRKNQSDREITVWKLHNFSVTQILREIIFGEYRSEKSIISTNLEALNFDFY